MELRLDGRDFRQMKTGWLELRLVFVRKETRTRGHAFCCMLALKLCRELERGLQAAFGATGRSRHAVTLPDALAPLSRLYLLSYTVNGTTSFTRRPRPDRRQAVS